MSILHPKILRSNLVPKNNLKKATFILLLIGLYLTPLAINLALYNQKNSPGGHQAAQPAKNAAQSSKKSQKLSRNEHFASLLDDELKISTDSREYDPAELTECKSLVYQALEALPEDHRSQLKKIQFMFDPDMRRGYGGQSMIRIRCIDVEKTELVAVFRHEMGHIVDTGKYIGSAASGRSSFKDGDLDVYLNDLSLKFYRISWTDEATLKHENNLHFVSGYAKTNPFEDFAESYNAYISQGSRFRAYAKESLPLKKKYEILKKYFFDGKEFGLEEDQKETFDLNQRNFDTTILPYDLFKSLHS